MDILKGFQLNVFKRFQSSVRNWMLKEYRSEGLFNTIMSTTGVFTTSNAEKLSAVYRAVEATASAVASLPFEPYLLDASENMNKATQHYLYDMLNKAPNRLNSRFTLMQMIVRSLHYEGNAYVEIERNFLGKITNLWFVPPTEMSVNFDPVAREISYMHTLTGRMLEPENVVHILNYTRNGYIGISTLAHAVDTLTTAHSAEQHASSFFQGGGAQAGIMTLAGNPSPKNLKAAKDSYFESTNGQTNGVAFVSGDMKYTPLSFNPEQAQLLESRKFSVIEIARFFQVPPSKIFDDSQTKYDNVEAANLTFLSDSVLPMAIKIALEFDRKIGIENLKTVFDTNKFLAADKDTQANYFLKLAQTAGITPNEIRKELGRPPVEGGDEAFMQVNMQTIKNIIDGKNDDKGNKSYD